ncbi:hypothetical protein N0O92_15570 [Alkalihalobacillus sp. MEB130]|uniref:hypothetical protein n=1 Tax=Alkalihalobacillus sp. MEB130 TaxID=2976704 RepID=UPI0028DE53D7|nr:hypothetical protein [Alkalihalobacillus sp. MEB130]MDT8861637.1 hypothetical protein [Alkalihalobacillus sp. MEB130]
MDLSEKQFSRLNKKSIGYLEKLQHKYSQEFGDFISKAELMSLIVRYARERDDNSSFQTKKE